MKWTNFTTGGSGGDSGDDIVWVPVVNNQNNSINTSVTCRWSTPIGINCTIKPTRYDQSFWVTLWGTVYKN